MDTRAAVKRVLVGRQRSTAELRRQLLPKRLALPVFASDPLSSVAYATQEMMIVLALAGTVAYALVGPLSLAVAILLAIVLVSYRQAVRAYPQGGGAYTVARENLGERSGLVAGGALLVDYPLTVAVSTAAGVEAIVSAVPQAGQSRVWLALALVAVVTLANLRGARETKTLFAVPTYAFVVAIGALIATGLARCAGDLAGGCPQAPTAGDVVEPVGALTVFLVLRAFASGATALTGVERISNGVGAFRYPQSRNAAATLGVTGVLAVAMFGGISYLARATGVVATDGMEQTVVAQLAAALWGEGVLFYVTQAATAGILILAANTAYTDFPRLASVLAGDRYLPRQFAARGDRLVFSNGVILLALGAGALIVAFDANLTRLIQLYVIGVFTSFTLSQSGMVRHHLRVRERGGWGSAALNSLGALTSATVLVVAAVATFAGGGWIVVVAIPTAAALMWAVHRHYTDVSVALHAEVARPEPVRGHHAVITLDQVDEAVARALSYAQATGAASIHALAVPQPEADIERRWAELSGGLPLEIVGQARDERAAVEALVAGLRARAAAVGAPDRAFCTAIIPETLSHSWAEALGHHRLALRLKSALRDVGEVVTADLTSPGGGPGPYTVEEPSRHHVVVLASAVNTATIRALAYADGLGATTVQALSVGLTREHARALLDAWVDWGLTVPLTLVDSPFRSLNQTVLGVIRDLHPDGRETVVTCVLPEFVLNRRYQQLLHNNSALMVRNAMLFERGVVATSVPYHLPDLRSVGAPDG